VVSLLLAVFAREKESQGTSYSSISVHPSFDFPTLAFSAIVEVGELFLVTKAAAEEGGGGGVQIGSHGFFVNPTSKDCCGSHQTPSHSAEKVYNSV
jgi:hypothetical protein